MEILPENVKEQVKTQLAVRSPLSQYHQSSRFTSWDKHRHVVWEVKYFLISPSDIRQESLS
eukprot:1668789-Amphidinium_carterae.1